ncbi:MAG: hypothetical protein OXH84_02545 [Gammaproteobacteria bacterium]|nr:hypothetical protein [Gammaproteobacteria bacterium]
MRTYLIGPVAFNVLLALVNRSTLVYRRDTTIFAVDRFIDSTGAAAKPSELADSGAS